MEWPPQIWQAEDALFCGTGWRESAPLSTGNRKTVVKYQNKLMSLPWNHWYEIPEKENSPPGKATGPQKKPENLSLKSWRIYLHVTYAFFSTSALSWYSKGRVSLSVSPLLWWDNAEVKLMTQRSHRHRKITMYLCRLFLFLLVETKFNRDWEKKTSKMERKDPAKR